MKLLIKDINSIPTPANGYGYAFIDAADNKLKIKKTMGHIRRKNDVVYICIRFCSICSINIHFSKGGY